MVGHILPRRLPRSHRRSPTSGKRSRKKRVVCIIEAMKVMNEIKAEISGVIAEIVAENGKPVQFGQVLFRVK